MFCLSVTVCFRVGDNRLNLEVLRYGGEGEGGRRGYEGNERSRARGRG